MSAARSPWQPGRRRLVGAALLGTLNALPRSATAQGGGARGLRIVCASPPGGTPDVIARHFAVRMVKAIVDNRPGAAGFLAVAALLQAPPDGATTLLGHAGLVTSYPFLYARLPYDAAADLVPMAPGAETAFGIAIGPAVPADVRSVAAFARWARLHPQLAQYGTPGVGTLTHVLAELLAHEASFKAQHIPYNGGPAVIADVVGGRLPAAYLPVGLLRQLHDIGRLHVLATSGARRSALLPEVPTLAELGYPRLVIGEWFGFFVRRGTPRATIEDLSSAIGAATTAPDLGVQLSEAGMQILSGTPAQMGQRIDRERAFWHEHIATTGIRIE